MATPYENILRKVESLSREEQLRLISELAENLRMHPESEAQTSILELQGLGKEIWRGQVTYENSATPMTYRTREGKQFLVMATGTGANNMLVAFALP